MQRLLWVCFAGAIGTGARYCVQTWSGRAFGTHFPYGTLIVNLVGSFAICLVMQMAAPTKLIGPELRLILTTGFLGGFTTYSAFNYETLKLLEENLRPAALAYVALTVFGSLAVGYLGVTVGRSLVA
jgi:CrcB protein